MAKSTRLKQDLPPRMHNATTDVTIDYEEKIAALTTCKAILARLLTKREEGGFLLSIEGDAMKDHARHQAHRGFG